MANKLYEETSIQAIANAIRSKGVSGQMTVVEMAAKVLAIPSGGGSSIHHEHGTFSYHTGTDRTAFLLTCDDLNYDNLVLYAQAIKTWKSIGGTWVEQATLDFSGTETATKWALGSMIMVDPPIPAIAGTRSDGSALAASNVFAIGVRRNVYASGTATFSQPTSGVTWNKSTNTISATMSTNFNLCTKNAGQTWEYDLWGWNNE